MAAPIFSLLIEHFNPLVSLEVYFILRLFENKTVKMSITYLSGTNTNCSQLPGLFPMIIWGLIPPIINYQISGKTRVGHQENQYTPSIFTTALVLIDRANN